jgi:hypothetical protein
VSGLGIKADYWRLRNRETRKTQQLLQSANTCNFEGIPLPRPDRPAFSVAFG